MTMRSCRPCLRPSPSSVCFRRWWGRGNEVGSGPEAARAVSRSHRWSQPHTPHPPPARVSACGSPLKWTKWGWRYGTWGMYQPLCLSLSLWPILSPTVSLSNCTYFALCYMSNFFPITKRLHRILQHTACLYFIK